MRVSEKLGIRVGAVWRVFRGGELPVPLPRPLAKSIPFGGSTVNAAFLLVTTAWLSGADAAPDAKPAAPAPMAAPCASCGDCNSCDGHKLKDKLRGWFHREDCACEKPCDTCGHAHAKITAHSDCGCKTCADTCNECSFSDRLKAKFNSWRHRDCGCDSGCGGCSGCGSAAPAAAPAKAPEELKKMPSDVKKTE